MKKTKLEGELNDDIKSQILSIGALKRTIENVSYSIHGAEDKMWKQIKKEFPDISENCSMGIENDVVVITDRLAD